LIINFFNLTGKIPLVIIFFPSRVNLDVITKLEWLCITSWYASKCRERKVCGPFSDQNVRLFLPIPQPWTLMASHTRHVFTQKAILAFARLLFFARLFLSGKKDCSWSTLFPTRRPPGWGDFHMKGTGMLVGKLEIKPKGDKSGRGSGFI